MVHSGNQEGGYQSYVATGDMEMNWSFGGRQGTVEITDFDAENADLDVTYAVNSPTGSTGFAGFGTSDTFGESYDSFGTAQGAFVNDGSDVAAGVIGSWDFNALEEGGFSQYSVGGVFMGVPATE